jgi:hypothetical protein
MKKKSLDVWVLFLILVTTTIAIRLFYLKYFTDGVVVNEDIYNQIKNINANDITKGLSDINSIYLAILYLASFIFNSYTGAGVYLNVFFQTVTIIIIFWDIYLVTKKYYAFRVSMLLAVFPTYIKRVSVLGTYNMYFMLGILLIVIVMVIVRKIFDIMNGRKIENSKCDEIKEIQMEEAALVYEKVKFLENPLPVPKTREHKTMDYAVEVADDDDFDIKDISDNDDFDI